MLLIFISFSDTDDFVKNIIKNEEEISMTEYIFDLSLEWLRDLELQFKKFGHNVTIYIATLELVINICKDCLTTSKNITEILIDRIFESLNHRKEILKQASTELVVKRFIPKTVPNNANLH